MLFAPTGCTKDDSRPQELAELIERAEEPFTFRFRYEAVGTRTRDCFRANTTFSGYVDQTKGIAIIEADDGRRVAEIRRGASAVAGRTVGVDGADWVSFRSPVEDPTYREALERALGTDLAPYLLAGDIPPSGRAIVEAALEEEATTVTAASRGTLRGRSVWRYGLLLPTEVIDVNGSGAELTVWLDADGTVVRIVIAAAQAGEEGSHRDGWRLDYSDYDADRVQPLATSRLQLGDVDPRELSSTASECRLPL